ncbi:NnrS family protein [Arhodomonas aquaeolei]|uniref:NnrS family protein n=1 Tax=Arhodomonas aquaeolei TaxID=2369 RepID=UPI002169CA48|nr:NnrS family protein [Arhodomonas aquaeolei]MCS4504615.1 NnrS family protein [Arhodomonas aquaeolei]
MSVGGRGGPSGQRVGAQALFFPLAAAHALLVVPLSVHALTGGSALLPGLATSTGHAHEMLFGFALAVVAGFTINRIRRPVLAALLTFWLAGRLAFLAAPGGTVALLANGLFASAVVVLAAPPFMRAAKKWRNRATGPLLIAIALAAVLTQVSDVAELSGPEHVVLREAVVLLAVLMLFMGGRLIAPAAAGHLRLQGAVLSARVQPRLEGALLLLGGIAVLLRAVPGAHVAAGGVLLLVAATAGLRLGRWRLWRCLDRHDLILLGAGYAWLALGLALLGAAWVTGSPMPTTALHAVTVGALGTLTITVMARARRIAMKRQTAFMPDIVLAVLLVGVAAVLRLTLPAWWTAASLLWSLAYTIALVHLLRLNGPAPGARQSG